jgi:hypothetical protein
MPGRLLEAASLEIAKDQRRAIALWQPLDFLVEQTSDVVALHSVSLRSSRRRALFVPAPTGCGQTRTRRCSNCDLMEPGPKRVPHPQTARFLDQHQKRRLKSIFDIMSFGQHAPANPQNHRPVPLDYNGKCQLSGLAAVGRKPFQELTVRELAHGPDVEQHLKLLDDRCLLVDCHRCDSPPEGVLPQI